MKYLVTGANGYMGSHVVKTLLDRGHQVYAVDIDYSNVDSRAERLKTNLFSGSETIYDEMMQPDVCIHLAWRNGFIHNADSHILELPDHYLFLKNMMQGGLKHLVVMGTMHEIGYWEGAIDENTPANPQSLYGIAKNALRQLTIELAEQNSICLQWLRGYYILGDDLKNNSIFSKLLKAAMEGKKTFPFTSGKNLYDFIGVEELAGQIVSVSEQTEVQGIINCCTGKPVSLANRVEQFIRDNNLDITLEYGAYPDREYDSPGVWGNPDKIEKILNSRKSDKKEVQ